MAYPMNWLGERRCSQTQFPSADENSFAAETVRGEDEFWQSHLWNMLLCTYEADSTYSVGDKVWSHPLSGIFIVRLVFKTKTHGLEIRVQKKKIIHQQQNIFSIWMKMGSSSLLAENWRVKCFWRRGQRRRRERRESSSLPCLSRGTT